MNENKIYESLFRVFEREFSTIGEYIAFEDANFTVYSIKIQELHLRICSEIENILKRVIHKNFLDEEEVRSKWNKKKLENLVKVEKHKEYKSISESLNAHKMRQVDGGLFGFPDFPFYLKIASDKINLNKKSVIFTSIIDPSSEKSTITPFCVENGKNVPFWWTTYNKLKHDKINNFNICTLNDLVHSFSGLFILMVYLTKYYNNRPIYNDQIEQRHSGISVGCNYWDFEATHFSSTHTIEKTLLDSIGMEETITEERYHEILNYFGKSDEKTLLDSGKRMLMDSNINSTENVIFHVFIDYKAYAMARTSTKLYRRKLQAAIFVN